MTLSEISELTMIDKTIQSMHQQLSELYARRQQITHAPTSETLSTAETPASEQAIDFTSIDLELSHSSRKLELNHS